MSAKVPICLPCWREAGHREDPPQPFGFPVELAPCTICERQTNHGIFVTEAEARELAKARRSALG